MKLDLDTLHEVKAEIFNAMFHEGDRNKFLGMAAAKLVVSEMIVKAENNAGGGAGVFPKCCIGWGLDSRVKVDGRWVHKWIIPNGDSGKEPCSFSGSSEELAGFHATGGIHFRSWRDGVYIIRYLPPLFAQWAGTYVESRTIIAVIPHEIWRSVEHGLRSSPTLPPAAPECGVTSESDAARNTNENLAREKGLTK